MEDSLPELPQVAIVEQPNVVNNVSETAPVVNSETNIIEPEPATSFRKTMTFQERIELRFKKHEEITNFLKENGFNNENNSDLGKDEADKAKKIKLEEHLKRLEDLQEVGNRPKIEFDVILYLQTEINKLNKKLNNNNDDWEPGLSSSGGSRNSVDNSDKDKKEREKEEEQQRQNNYDSALRWQHQRDNLNFIKEIEDRRNKNRSSNKDKGKGKIDIEYERN